MSDLEHRRRVLGERARKLADRAAKESGRAIRTQAAVVSVGSERFAFPSAAVREIVAMPKPTRLPGLPPFILGIAHCRGELVSVVDLARWFGVTTDGTPRFLLLLRAPAGLVGVTAEQVLGFRAVHEDELSPPDDASDRPVAAITKDLTALIDVDRLVADDDLLVR